MPRERTPRSRDGSLSRRRYLALTGLVGTGVLAGCGGDGGGTPDDGTPSSTPESDTPSETPDEATASATPGEETPSATPAAGLDPSFLDQSPSSEFAPTDGFADADWLATAEDLQVLKVTTLDASGEGSLPWALNQSGPRVVVFEVGGVVDLRGENVSIEEPNLYVAGQTAPSPGITVIRGGVVANADDVIVQHLRVRPGDRLTDGPRTGDPAGSAVDALSAGVDTQNVLFDHCSVSWGSDENMSAGGGERNRNVTFTNNVNAECLSQSPLHDESEHSKATLINDYASDTALVGNVFVHNMDRHPRIKGSGSCAVVNNYVYNFEEAMEMGADTDDYAVASVVGNYYHGGPETESDVYMIRGEGSPGARAYVAYNETVNPELQRNNSRVELLTERPLWPDGLAAIATDDVVEHNLATAGARPADRTPHDERILGNARDHAGGVIDSQSEVGGYPDLESTERELDAPAPGDGLADWLAQHTRAVELPDASPP